MHSNVQGTYVSWMATWKPFLQFYFHGSSVSFLWNVCSYPDKGKMEDENVIDSSYSHRNIWIIYVPKLLCAW